MPYQRPNLPPLTHESLVRALDDYEFRRRLASTLEGYCLVYLPHYLTAAPAEFHPELLYNLSNEEIRFLLVEGFRGSAKSVYGSLALPIWLATEKAANHKFILPIADTSLQAGINIANIKQEFENNKLLLQDYGQMRPSKVDEPPPDPTLESEEEWQSKNMLLSNGVRILARSRGQKVRGLRHRQYRPSDAIIDDPEDLEWVRKKENRDKTERWLTGEVIPGLDRQHGRLVVIGNMLSNDALVARLKKKKAFKVLEYPLIAADGHCTWPAVYPNQQALDDARDLMGPVAWQREMLLRVVPEEGAPLKPEDLHYYDVEPVGDGLIGTGVDLAISKKQTADFTSMVSGKLLFSDGRPKIYVQPAPVNERLDMPETVGRAKLIHIANPGLHQFFVEEVAYQKAAIDEMEREMLPVIRMKPLADKRARLMVVVSYIKNGTVVFPHTGCEDLIMQLLGFGIEPHDDLVDALVYLILGMVNQGLAMPEVIDLTK